MKIKFRYTFLSYSTKGAKFPSQGPPGRLTGFCDNIYKSNQVLTYML